MRVILFILFLFIPAGSISAQELHHDLQGVWRAEVLEVVKEEQGVVLGTRIENSIQTLRAVLLDGVREGEEITFENDYLELKPGDKFYVDYMVTIDGREFYSVREIDRRFSMLFLLGIFVATILIFGGMQGLRSLISLAGSLLVIIYVLVPTLVQGISPVPVSIAVAGAVLFCAIFFTHGFNRRSLIAYAGTMIAVGITGLLAYFSIQGTGLTGFSSDESIYLNFNTGGQLDFVGLLLAGVIIGALGVLDDIAVTQVAVVRELFSTDQTLTRAEVYHRAVRIGKEHVGALVNTLVLAYTGVALPILLLFSMSESTLFAILNREIFATEIVRSLVGSIGLVLTVPITTLLAVWFLYHERGNGIEEKNHGHHHYH